MDPNALLLITLILGACVGLLLVVRRGTRLQEAQPQAGPEPSRLPAPARRHTGVPSVIGPSETVVLRPADGNPLVIGPASAIRVSPSSQPPGEPVLVRPSEDPVLVVRPAEPLVVEPPPRGAWDERGWARRSNNGRTTYEGYYQVLDRRGQQSRRFPGRVVVGRRSTTPYIADPPHQIKRHPKGPCFTVTKAPWFRIEWRRPATNVDDAILYVEKILDEALNGRRT